MLRLTITVVVLAQLLLIALLLVNRIRQKRASANLRDRERRLRALLNAPVETIALLDREGVFLDINPSGARRFGSTPEALVGRSVFELMPADLARSRKSYIEQVLNTGEAVHFEDQRAGAWFDNSIYPLTAPDGGEIPGVIVFARDVSDHRRADEELAASEERFRNLVQQSPLAIEILAPDGRIEHVNPAWVRLWGFEEEDLAEILGSYNMLTDRQAEELGIMPLIRRAFAGEVVVLPVVEYAATRNMEEIGLDHIKGRTVWIACHLYPVKDREGRVTNVINTYMDITSLRQAEQEAREQRDALARVERTTSMGQLTGAIAHELNQPLTGILSNAQAAELLITSGQCGSEVLSEIVSAIVADTKRAGGVLRNLRELYREQKGEYLPLDLNAVVDETMKLLNSEIVVRKIELVVEPAGSLPAVDGNRTQLQQVLVNLIMNALEAVGELGEGEGEGERRIALQTTAGADGVTAVVVDSGPGIDEEKIGSIFEPLATWKPGGTGMGLAICNSIVEAHGGRMHAENRPGGGARVGFSLPVAKGETAT